MKVRLQRNIQDVGKAGETLSVGTEYGMRLISQGQAVLEKRKSERKAAAAPKVSEPEKPKKMSGANRAAEIGRSPMNAQAPSPLGLGPHEMGEKSEKDCDSHGPV